MSTSLNAFKAAVVASNIAVRAGVTKTNAGGDCIDKHIAAINVQIRYMHILLSGDKSKAKSFLEQNKTSPMIYASGDGFVFCPYYGACKVAAEPLYVASREPKLFEALLRGYIERCNSHVPLRVHVRNAVKAQSATGEARQELKPTATLVKLLGLEEIVQPEALAA